MDGEALWADGEPYATSPLVLRAEPAALLLAVAMTRVLFLPGISGEGSFWDPVAQRLPDHWQTETLEWPGLGPGAGIPDGHLLGRPHRVGSGPAGGTDGAGRPVDGRRGCAAGRAGRSASGLPTWSSR